MLFDRLAGFAQRHAGHVDAAVGPQIDGAVRADQVLPFDLLLAGAFGQADRDFRRGEDVLQVLDDRVLGLAQGQVRDLDRAIGRTRA